MGMERVLSRSPITPPHSFSRADCLVSDQKRTQLKGRAGSDQTGPRHCARVDVCQIKRVNVTRVPSLWMTLRRDHNWWQRWYVCVANVTSAENFSRLLRRSIFERINALNGGVLGFLVEYIFGTICLIRSSDVIIPLASPASAHASSSHVCREP